MTRLKQLLMCGAGVVVVMGVMLLPAFGQSISLPSILGYGRTVGGVNVPFLVASDGTMVTTDGNLAGTIASGQVAFGAGTNQVGGDSHLTWNNSTKALTVGGPAAALDIIPTSTHYASLPTPGMGTYPLAVVDDSTVTTGTVSAGSGTHVNVIVWTGSLWTVLKNLT